MSDILSGYNQQPSIFGGQPNQAQDLLRLFAGLGAANDARIPGGFLAHPGFSGALGSAVEGAMGGSQQQALSNANAQNALAEAEMKRIQVPWLQQQMQMRQQYAPMIMREMQNEMGGGQGPYGQGTTPGSVQTASTPRSNPMGGPLQVAPERRDGMIDTALKSAGAPSAMGPMMKSMVDLESGWDAHAWNPNSKALGLGQIEPATATNPGFGMKGTTPENLYDAQSNLNFMAQYLYGRGKSMGLQDSDWGTPRSLAAAAAYHGPQTDSNGVNGPMYARAVANRMQLAQNMSPGVASDVNAMQGGMGQGNQGDGGAGADIAHGYIMPPEQALVQSQAAMQRAQQLEFMGMPGSDVYKQRAQQLQAYANSVMQAQAEPRTLRGQGSAFINPLAPQGKQVTQVPIEVEGVNQNTGGKTRYFVNPLDTGAPRPPGLPADAPPGAVAAIPGELGPGQTIAMKEGAEDLGSKESRDQYEHALNTKSSMAQIESALNTLNNGASWSTTGPMAPHVQQFARMWNQFAATWGASKDVMFDPNKVAEGELATKLSKVAGMQLTNSMFGRSHEAASIVQSAQSAVPGLNNTPNGAKVVLNSIREGAQYLIDKHTFENNWYFQHKGNMVGADVAFAQENPPEKYGYRAVSQVHPYEVSSKEEAEKRFLPGTWVIVKGYPGKAMIPGQQGIQFQGAPMPAQGQ